jgi:hypothetical protein
MCLRVGTRTALDQWSFQLGQRERPRSALDGASLRRQIQTRWGRLCRAFASGQLAQLALCSAARPKNKGGRSRPEVSWMSPHGRNARSVRLLHFRRDRHWATTHRKARRSGWALSLCRGSASGSRSFETLRIVSRLSHGPESDPSSRRAARLATRTHQAFALSWHRRAGGGAIQGA